MDKNTQEVIQQLASALGTTTEKLWGILLRQAFIDGIDRAVWIIPEALAAILLWRYCWRKLMSEDADDCEPPFMVGLVIAGIFALVALYNASTFYQQLLNPEYWALQQILTAFKQ